MKGITVKDLFSLKNVLIAQLFEGVVYPFEVLPKIGDFIKQIGPKLDKSVYENRGDDIWIARSAIIAASASITGPCIIGERTEVRHCAFIRGNAFVGDDCVVGNSTELKNVVLIDCVQVPHYNYVGDSVLGFRSHMGAGAVISNVKADKKNVVIKNNGEKIETGLKKFGAILGDYVEVGCGSVLNPGTVVCKHTNIYPLSMVRGVIPENSIYKKAGEVVLKTI